MATRPATTPEAAPTRGGVAVAELLHDEPAEHGRAGGGRGVDPDQGGRCRRRASSEPALNPNQPNHSRPAPSIVERQVVRAHRILPKPIRLPMTSASTRPAIPALMWTTVPPAKSIGATLAVPSVGRRSATRGRLAPEEAAAPDHVGDREVDEGHPQAAEDQPGRELRPVGDGAADQGDGDDAKVSWKRDEDELGDAAVALEPNGLTTAVGGAAAGRSAGTGSPMMPAMFSVPNDIE